MRLRILNDVAFRQIPPNGELSRLVFLGYESWTLNADLEIRIQALKTNATGRCLAQREHKTNEYLRQQVNIRAEHQELLLSTIKRRK